MTDENWKPIGDILPSIRHQPISTDAKSVDGLLLQMYGNGCGVVLSVVFEWAITTTGLYCLTTPYDIALRDIYQNRWWQALCANRAFEPSHAVEALARARELLTSHPVVKPFFNRPVEPNDGTWFRDRDLSIEAMLVEDISKARTRLVVASAWFTSEPIAQAILDSKCKNRMVLLNRSDLQRGEKTAVKMLFDHVRPGKPGNYGDNAPPDGFMAVGVLGAVKHHDGIMHHKWVVSDDVVWVGSYNLTKQATNNYETMVRIDHPATADQFANEAKDLYGQVSHHRTRVDVNYCAGCSRYFPYYLCAFVDSHDGPVCYDCAKDW